MLNNIPGIYQPQASTASNAPFSKYENSLLPCVNLFSTLYAHKNLSDWQGIASKCNYLMKFTDLEEKIKSWGINLRAKAIEIKVQAKIKEELHSKIESIPFEERVHLTNFFKYTFLLSNFAFTIFGEKPLSFAALNLNLEQPKLPEIFKERYIGKCWQTWIKHCYLFPLKGLSMLSYTHPRYDLLEIMIINHTTFLKEIETNLATFHEILGGALTPQEILNEFIKGKGKVFDTIRAHDGLFGTLLGYGKNNSFEFMRQGGGEKMEGSFPFVPEPEEEETKYIPKPSFCVIANTEETINLRKSYEKQSEFVNKIYQSSDFLEQVLLKLTNYY